MVKRVLSLDGGGVRSHMQALFLHDLELALGKPLAETFDLVVGTSGGGLLALTLAASATGRGSVQGPRLVKSSDRECAREIMEKSFWDRWLPFQNRPKYTGAGKRAVIRRTLGDDVADSAITSLPAKVAVTAFDLNTCEMELFRSYGDHPGPRGAPTVEQAADATSAAPTYFPTVRIGETYYSDGGVGAKDPSLLALGEARRLWPGEEVALLSVGTGRCTTAVDGKASMGWGAIRWLANGLLDMIMEGAADATRDACAAMLGEKYLRVNVAMPVFIPLDATSDEESDEIVQCGRQMSHHSLQGALRLLESDAANHV